MSNQTDMTPIEIAAADKGGFYVTVGTNHPGYMPAVSFAGTLDECLDFIRGELSPKSSEAERDELARREAWLADFNRRHRERVENAPVRPSHVDPTRPNSIGDIARKHVGPLPWGATHERDA